MNNLWIFRFFYRKRLLEQKASPFKIKNETDSIRSACIDEVSERTKPLLLIAKNLVYKIAVKSVQNNRTRVFRSESAPEEVKSNPLFSQNEITQFTRKYYINGITIIAFILGEAVLYYIIIPLFIPQAPLIIQIIVSLFLSFFIVVCLNYGTEKHFAYRNAVTAHEKKQITASVLKQYKDKQWLGYFLIVLSLGVSVFVAIARVFYLEQVDPQGLSPERFNSVKQASFFASFATLGITIMAAILLALIKHDQLKLGEKYHVFCYWKRMHTRRNRYIRQSIAIAHSTLAIIEKETNKHWMFCIDLKRVYHMQQEFDEKYEGLYQEYQATKDDEAFAITDAVFRKYDCIQCADEHLFKYGIRNCKEIKPIILYCMYVLKLPEEHITEQLSNTPSAQSKNENSLFSLNGKGTKLDSFTTTNNEI
jgi:hypothetical protein